MSHSKEGAKQPTELRRLPGITIRGNKPILGLKRGDTEKAEVCKILLQEPIECGLKSDQPLLFVRDGSNALKKAVRKVCGGGSQIRRCVRHEERNALGYLSQSGRAEFCPRWKLIHGVTQHGAAKRNRNAWPLGFRSAIRKPLRAWRRQGPNLRRDRPGSFGRTRKDHTSGLSHRSPFSCVRVRARRMRHWRTGADQIERWAGTCLWEAEKGFRAVRRAKDLPDLTAKVRGRSLTAQRRAA